MHRGKERKGLRRMHACCADPPSHPPSSPWLQELQALRQKIHKAKHMQAHAAGPHNSSKSKRRRMQK